MRRTDAGALEAPAWTMQADTTLRRAARDVRLIESATPTNLGAELLALEECHARGQEREPAFTYLPVRPALASVRSELEQMAEHLGAEGDLGRAYAARAREIALEVTVALSIGTPHLREVAAERYGGRRFDAEADTFADELLRDAGARDADGKHAGAGEVNELIVADDLRDPRSLLCRMRAEVGRQRLGVRVVVADELSALAAVGDGVVFVAKGRKHTDADAKRTVLHEMEGHVLPGVRAKAQPIGLFSVGTAQGSDDQEGRALALERRAGLFDTGRMRELGLRHKAGRMARQGAGFVEVVRALTEAGAAAGVTENAAEEISADHAALRAALRIAARALRGGGLARELVYLPSLLEVEAAVAEDPEVERVMASGRVGVAWVDVMRQWVRAAE